MSGAIWSTQAPELRVRLQQIASAVPVVVPYDRRYIQTLFGQDRETVDTAYPGDILGLVNANDLRVGDSVYVDKPAQWPPLPAFAPEFFMRARVKDTSKFKQFRKGLIQLDEEGVIQVLRDQYTGDVEPVLAAVGQMQFEVAVHRLENEFGAPVALSAAPYSVARRTDAESADEIRRLPGVAVMERSSDGALLALFENPYYLQRIESEKDHLRLDPVLVD